MGLVLPQNVNVRITNVNKSYYKQKGYSILECNSQNICIEVNVEDLPIGSSTKVEVNCDCCHNNIQIKYSLYNKYLDNSTNTFYCSDCRQKRRKEQHYKIQKEKYRKILCEELLEYINKNGLPTNFHDVLCKANNMHSIRLYYTYLGNTPIEWLKACGYNLTPKEKARLEHRSNIINYSKEEVIAQILDMQRNINRPLLVEDFNNPDIGTVSYSYIQKYFGSFNQMKKELGLKIVQENMCAKTLTKEEFIYILEDLAAYIKSTGKLVFSVSEYEYIAKQKGYRSYGCMQKTSYKYFKKSFSEVIKDYGIKLNKHGIGIVTILKSGEKCISQFEYMFSSFLEAYGLIYNIDYFRDVPYKSFIPNYNGNMNCDYVIYYKNKIIYVEIAGMLDDYKKYYYQNIYINSSSKEKYKKDLLKKEEMFKNNNLVYFLLFPCDLSKDNFINILNNPTNELRYKIETDNNTYIHWELIRQIGELKFKYDKKGKRQIDYTIEDKKEVALDA